MSGVLIYSLWAQKHFCCRKCRRGPLAAKNPPQRPHSLIWEDSVVVQGELSLDAMAQLRRDVHCLWRKEFSAAALQTSHLTISTVSKQQVRPTSVFLVLYCSTMKSQSGWCFPTKRTSPPRLFLLPGEIMGMGQEFRGKREGRNTENQQCCPGDTSTKVKFHCDLGESFERSLRT